MRLHELKRPKGSRKRRKIVGRGPGSGHGKTSCRGENGQGSREGRGVLRGSEGGQMALIRRLPKVGFRSKRPIVYQVVKLARLSKIKAGTVVDHSFLKSHGLINRAAQPCKVLGDGDIKVALTIRANSFSKSAKEKILKAGGKAEVIKAVQISKKK